MTPTPGASALSAAEILRVLEPFAETGDKLPADWHDTQTVFFFQGDRPGVKVGQFRAARDLAARLRAPVAPAPIEPGEGELLPCPFCGGEMPIIFEFKEYSFDRLKVHCDNCGVSGSHYHAYEIALARAQWNRRAALPKPATVPSATVPVSRELQSILDVARIGIHSNNNDLRAEIDRLLEGARE